jgi:hypothetical protein
MIGAAFASILLTRSSALGRTQFPCGTIADQKAAHEPRIQGEMRSIENMIAATRKGLASFG